MNPAAWIFIVWSCAWPVLAIVFFTLWFVKVRHPKKRLAWVDDQKDDDD